MFAKSCSKSSKIACVEFHEDSEVGKRAFVIHSVIATLSSVAAKSLHAYPALSLPANSVGGNTDKYEETYVQPSDVWAPVASIPNTNINLIHFHVILLGYPDQKIVLQGRLEVVVDA